MFIPTKTPKPSPHVMVGDSTAVQSLRRLIQSLAPSSSTALITGESGTGKELVAQSLHGSGPRADGPFIPLNCGAIPRELIESELFGHRKGSFTGAISDRLGRFELAHGGTLFLDEIGDLPADMQVKLLRVLQERRILPVGASKEVPIDVRVIAATHKNLEQEVQAGRFREDLYYRLNVLPIQTAPLRDRADDILSLLNHYADLHAIPSHGPIRLDEQMVGLLQRYRWPGNVRELSNLVDRLSTLFPGQLISPHQVPTCMLPPGLAVMQIDHLRQHHGIDEVPLAVLYTTSDAATHDGIGQNDARSSGSLLQAGGDEMVSLLTDLPPSAGDRVIEFQHAAVVNEASNDEINAVEQAIYLAQGIQTLPPQGISLKQHLIDIERSLIEQALERTRGNVSQTAKLLRLQRTTLIEKINKYDLRSSG